MDANMTYEGCKSPEMCDTDMAQSQTGSIHGHTKNRGRMYFLEQFTIAT